MGYKIERDNNFKFYKKLMIRDDYTSKFEENYRYIDDRIESDNIRVLNFYGLGGIGKTSLCNMIEHGVLNHDTRKYSYYDFSKGTNTKDILCSIKEDLSTRYEYKFPVFECALLFYEKKNKKTVSKYLASQNSTFLDDKPSLSPILDLLDNVPMVSTAIKMIKALDSSVNLSKNIFKNRNYKSLINELDTYTETQILELLPTFFSEDMEENLKKENRAFTFILDTYELEVNENQTFGNPFMNDLWLRGEHGLIRHTPKCLWLIAGRECLKWSQYDSNWDHENLDLVLVRPLSLNDTFLYIKEQNITDEEVMKSIYLKSQGVPLSIDMLIDIYKKTGTINDLSSNANGIIDMLIVRLLKYFSLEQRELFYHLVCLKRWDKELMLKYVEKSEINFSELLYEQLLGSSLIRSEDSVFYIAREVWNLLIEQCSDRIFHIYCKTMLDHDLTDKINFDSFVIKLNHTKDLTLKKKITELMESVLEKLLEDNSTVEFETIISMMDRQMVNIEYSDFQLLMYTFMIKYYIKKANYSKAYEISNKITVEKTDTTDLSSLLFLSERSNALLYVGRFDEAIELDKVIINHSMSNEFITKAKINMAVALFSKEQYDQTCQLCEALLQGNDLDIINQVKIINNQGNAYYKLGKFEDAFNCYQKVKEVMIHLPQYGDYDILKVNNNEATALVGLHKFHQALQIYMDTYNSFYEKLGKNHPETLKVHCNVATVKSMLDHHEEAYQIYTDIYQQYVAIYGEEHSETVFIQYRLSCEEYCLGMMDSAITNLRKVISIRESSTDFDRGTTEKIKLFLDRLILEQ